MNETLIISIALIITTITALVFIRKYFMQKSEMISFRKQLNKIRTTDREQPLMVASFGAPSIELAKEINALTADLKKLAIEATENEKKMKIVMAGVSHDFRTPLTSADGYLQMIDNTLTDSEVSEELREYLDIVKEKVSYLKKMSDEFFEVSYLEAVDKAILGAVRFDTVLSNVMLSAYNSISEKNLLMKPEIPEEKLLVLADEHYLTRILENLFSNAEKYAVSYISVNVSTEKDNIRLKVENDVSVNTDFEETHIFDPFYRGTGRSGPGTGLGLYICKELADFMNYSINGHLDKGVFSIELIMPAAEALA